MPFQPCSEDISSLSFHVFASEAFQRANAGAVCRVTGSDTFSFGPVNSQAQLGGGDEMAAGPLSEAQAEHELKKSPKGMKGYGFNRVAGILPGCISGGDFGPVVSLVPRSTTG